MNQGRGLERTIAPLSGHVGGATPHKRCAPIYRKPSGRRRSRLVAAQLLLLRTWLRPPLPSRVEVQYTPQISSAIAVFGARLSPISPGRCCGPDFYAAWKRNSKARRRMARSPPVLGLQSLSLRSRPKPYEWNKHKEKNYETLTVLLATYDRRRVMPTRLGSGARGRCAEDRPERLCLLPD